MAASAGRTDIIDILLGLGVDVNARDENEVIFHCKTFTNEKMP